MNEENEAEGGFQPRSPSAEQRAEALMHDMGVRALAGELSATKRSDRAVVLALMASAIRDAERAAREATMDEHGILHGEAATAFVAEMERVRSPEEVAAHSAFMKECETVYRESQEKRPGSLESEVKRLRDAIRFALSPESGFACPASTEERLRSVLG